jgi:ketosteroid isomerase-like protein
MSAKLDLVRSIFADWERGNFSRDDWAHPEFEHVVVGGPQPGSGTLATMSGIMGQWFAAWDAYRAEAVECRELDDERVLVFTRASGRGKTSGLELDELQTRGANVFHVCDGKVARLVNYSDRDRALSDLGLEA